jgi:hypothetical protein
MIGWTEWIRILRDFWGKVRIKSAVTGAHGSPWKDIILLYVSIIVYVDFYPKRPPLKYNIHPDQ